MARARARCILAAHRKQKGRYRGELKPTKKLISCFLVFIESSGAGGGT
jgi:hypothetical protein